MGEGLRGMCQMDAFNKISTSSDYVAWWPELLAGMRQWKLNAALPEEEAAEKQLAMLVGDPFITQRVRFGEDGSFKGGVLPPFNATYGQPCPWTANSAAEMACMDDPSGILETLTSCAPALARSPRRYQVLAC